MKHPIIYHIVSKAQWEAQQDASSYYAEHFEKEQFIHASTRSQLNATANRYYQQETSIYVLHIDTTLLTVALKYERSASLQEDFPHIYGGINKEAIIKAVPYTKLILETWTL